MTTSPNLLRDDPARLLRHYLLPAIGATLVTSIYIIADTVMLGRGVGASAIVALNLALPLFSILFAIGMLFGNGGGILYSVARGAQDSQRATAAFSTALACVIAAALCVLLLGTVFLQPICAALGATADNLGDVMRYSSYVVHFTPAFVFSTFFQVIVRNDRAPRLAMAAVLSGSIANIILDYIFIFRLGMGLTGGAVATVIGNALTVGILLTHFVSHSCALRFDLRSISFSMLRQIVACGTTSALIEAASGIVIFAFNLQLRRYLGENAIVVYGIIANIAIICMSLFNGAAQAALPIVAANYGASLPHRIRQVRQKAARMEFLTGLLLASTAYWMPGVLLALFVTPTPIILSMGYPALQTYFPAFALTGLNILYSTYFQSVVQPQRSLIISILRGIVLPLLLVRLLPALFGGSAIWIVIPLTEALTLGTAVLLLRMPIRPADGPKDPAP